MDFSYKDLVTHLNEPQYASNRFKILIIGKSGTGRSSLVRRFKHNLFHDPKEEIALPEITVLIRAIQGFIVKADVQILELSSFACNEDSSTLAKVHIARRCFDINGLLLIYDTTNLCTFTELFDYIPVLQRMIAPDVDIFVVGTKTDLVDSRAVTFEEAEKKSQEFGFSLFETSAVTGNNCEELLLEVLDRLADRRSLGQDNFIKSEVAVNITDETESVEPSLLCWLPNFWKRKR